MTVGETVDTLVDRTPGEIIPTEDLNSEDAFRRSRDPWPKKPETPRERRDLERDPETVSKTQNEPNAHHI